MSFVIEEPPEYTLPPGTGPTLKFQGPWFQTQLVLSGSIGLFSFLVFSFSRRRWPLLFAPRTKLKGFSPHEAHTEQSYYWILPTIRISELSVLQIVGLDAAVLLNFFKMSFLLFSACSVPAILVLMPLNAWKHVEAGEGDEDPDDPDRLRRLTGIGWDLPLSDWVDAVSQANAFLFIQLIFTYLFTALTMRFLYKNYQRFIRARQLFSLELVHSIAARTVMVSALPQHLRGERTLANYFEALNLPVESVSLCREVGSLDKLLKQRTAALLQLEAAWTSYVGNPCAAEAYDPSATGPLGDTEAAASAPARLVVPHRARPTLRPHYFGAPVDAINYWEARYGDLDEQVRRKRKSGKFKATHIAFVTFESMAAAQTAAQVVTSPNRMETEICLAPEPRDIVWANMGLTPGQERARDLSVRTVTLMIFLFWVFPISFLAGLLSYQEIQKVAPWLAKLIDQNDTLRAMVQNSLPSVAMVTLNGLLPMIFEGLSYAEGLRARSWIEYALMKKYFLFLLVNVVFIFLFASTYLQTILDLAHSPDKIPEKLAQALQKGSAQHFFLSYIILQGIGIMPLQLLNLGVVAPQLFYRAFVTRTPRDYAELNAPPMVNYGAVYPQAILVFVITILYSVIQPLILVFGAAFFGIAYVVYKYKLLFVFYKPYESQGQAWPITFVRLMWGVVIFQILMTGIFTLRKIVLAPFMIPLLLFTVYWTWWMDKSFSPLSRFVSLSSVCEVQRGEDTSETAQLRNGHPVSWSQSNLNRRRYAQNDDTLYVAPEDERTDYSQPPMTNWYPGVLNTGKRRYGHPALTGVLPHPWLPIKPGEALANFAHGDLRARNDAVVLTLRRKKSGRPLVAFTDNPAAPATADDAATAAWQQSGNELTTSPGGPPQTLRHRLSFDPASGVISLPDALDDSDSEADFGSPHAASDPGTGAGTSGHSATPSEDGGASEARTRRYSTYYHHPERRQSAAI